jgi:hypothetical protein
MGRLELVDLGLVGLKLNLLMACSFFDYYFNLKTYFSVKSLLSR